jgi:hypothetical protein
MDDNASPSDEYTARLRRKSDRAEFLRRRADHLSNARLAVFVLGASFLVLSLMAPWASLWILCVPITVFIALVVVHEKTHREWTRVQDAERYYAAALVRLSGEWPGTGSQGNTLLPADHPYAADLDLFGEGSLFELLCTARTRAGEETLAAWLCDRADKEEIEARQDAVKEWRGALDLREDLALLGGMVRSAFRPDTLRAWASKPVKLPVGWPLRVAQVLTGAAAFTAVGWAFFGFGTTPFFLVLAAVILCASLMKKSVVAASEGIDRSVKDLRILALVLKRLEEEPVQSKKLTHLQQALRGTGGYASSRIARLQVLLERKDWQRNQFLSIFAFVLLWDVHFTYAIERWREENGHAILDWMDSVGQLEALAALAGYAYERPTRPFPEIVESGPVFEGIELGHPLIAEEEVVPNSVSLGESPRALIVSGSNMSGKSTLLRTVGINAILALAGAPVCATSLRISPLSLGATLRVQDSIQSGTSRFYAEIKKLKQLTAMAESGTSLLFLLDELFSGTNSHDREIGANALLKGLLEAGAVGLVTTHDLALTKAGGADGAPIQNVHFEDHLEGDRLVFDYQMRPGIVTKSNALALMRAVGLKV